MWFLQGRCVYQRILIYSTSFGTLSNLSINAEFELCDRIQLLPLEGNDDNETLYLSAVLAEREIKMCNV